MFYDYLHQDMTAAERDNYQERLYQAEHGTEEEEVKDIEEEYLSRITGREIEIEDNPYCYKLRAGLKKTILRFDPFKNQYLPLREEYWDFPDLATILEGARRLRHWQRENRRSFQGF